MLKKSKSGEGVCEGLKSVENGKEGVKMAGLENGKEAVMMAELEKLGEIFKDVEAPKRMLVEGLLLDAAFLKAENEGLRELLGRTGTVKVHPKYPDVQKPIEAARQYRQNLNSYAVVIKTLNGVLSKNIMQEDDELDMFE